MNHCDSPKEIYNIYNVRTYLFVKLHSQKSSFCIKLLHTFVIILWKYILQNTLFTV